MPLFRESASPAHVRERYDEWHTRAESPDAAANAPWHELLFRYLNPVRDVSGRRVLEIGCGRGELAARLGDGPAAPQLYIAADLAGAALTFARRRTRDVRHRGALRYAATDMQAIGLNGGMFDTVISCETIEHLPDPVAALREVHRVLKPGGRLFLTTPNYLGVFGAYRVYLRATGRRYTEGGQPICRVTSLPRTIGWVRRAGLRIVNLDADGHYALWPGRLPSRRVCPPWLSPVAWLFGLHSIVVAEKPGASGTFRR
jgi:2-polyprenyl-3-methyl-5-hydroxy-6-metoxy-1,4-benzoquinol methylase